MSVPIDRAGLPFIGGAALLAVASAIAFGWAVALPFVAAAGFFAFFFRDPVRHASAGDGVVLSPADGRVIIAGRALADASPTGEWQQVSIFLSPMDVHVNRVPVTGRVTKVDYRPGRFLPAYRPEAGAINERSEIWIENRGRVVVARQVVGILARRVVCRVTPGTRVQAGDRYGIMKFGSRMDVFVPVTAELRVSAGDAVRGGETIIAVLH
jgi:phosphatidylserine decarboxylase